MTRASTGTPSRRRSAGIRALRLEDLLVFVWLAFVQPLTIGPHTRAINELGQQGTLWGVAYVVAAGTAVVCLASRSPDEPTLAWTGALSPHSYAPLPFVIAISIFAGFGIEDIGTASADVGFVPVLCLALAAFFFYAHLPTLPSTLRRISVIPIALVASATFNGIMFGIFSQIGLRTFVQVGPGLLVFLIAFAGIFYGIFIFSPAQIADPKGSWTDWAVRYGLFVVASLVGISLLGATHR